MSTKSCPNCGAQVPAGAAFCDNCGTPLAAAVVLGICPNCRAAVQSDDYFCNQCGYALRPQPQSQATAKPLAITPDDLDADDPVDDDAPTPAGNATPRLLVLPGGNTLELPADKDEYIIGRVDPASGSFPDVDLVPFGGEEGGVSRRHARITRAAGHYTIEDLNSVNYTFLNKEKIEVGFPRVLNNGDEIRLGRVLLQFRVD